MEIPRKVYRYVRDAQWKSIQESGEMIPYRNLCMHHVSDGESVIPMSSEHSTLQFIALHPLVAIFNLKDTVTALTLPRYCHQKSSFFFLEPKPKEWVDCGEFSRLINCIGNLTEIRCLEVDLEKSDGAFVHDWKEHLNSTKVFARDYYKKRVSLTDYNPCTFELPEVVVRKSLPLRRIRIYNPSS